MVPKNQNSSSSNVVGSQQISGPQAYILYCYLQHLGKKNRVLGNFIRVDRDDSIVGLLWAYSGH